jgi:cyclopropane-fatty-acyl-phospholipid synthase
MNRTERIVTWFIARMGTTGTLNVTLPGGAASRIGSGTPHGDVTFLTREALRHTLRNGVIGFAEGYMDGTIRTSNLADLLRWAAVNHDAWYRSVPARTLHRVRKLWTRIRPERRHPRVRSMTDHYNLGNDFYATWLDPSLTYSSARFAAPDQPLEEAQRHKYETIARHAGIEPGMHVLEIGCGWGGFAAYAAGELGCTVVGLTIAREQADFARKRIAELGLADRVEIRLEDFRETSGSFDAVVSIEMIESIDETQWPALFDTIAVRLAPGGRAALQAITIADHLWEQYRAGPDFIQQYIFPGGQLPAPKVLRSLAAGSGLRVEQIETFGLDYARTLEHWHHRFAEAWPDLAGRDGLDEKFRRMWELYLTLCEAGFRSGRVAVEQWVFSAPANPRHRAN